MSGRGDIAPNDNGWRRLSYTCKAGWVDWGHALPGAAKELRDQMIAERSDSEALRLPEFTFRGEPAYGIQYGFSMGKWGINVSPWRNYVIQKGLSYEEKKRAALGIYLTASHDFESLQTRFPYSFTRSGYSMEDLVSNLIGFHRGWIPDLGNVEMRGIVGEVSVEESYHMWDTYIEPIGGLGASQNRTLRPRLFPSDACTDTTFPPLLESTSPLQAGTVWQKLEFLLIGSVLYSPNVKIDVTAGGEVTINPL